MTYYYFRKTNGQLAEILRFDHEINTELNKWLVKLTEEQKAYYMEHPNATIWEVEHCRPYPPYIPPVIPIGEKRKEAISEIDRMSRDTLSVFVDQLGFANAVATSLYAKSKGLVAVYDDEEVLSTAVSFLEKGNLCRQKYHEFKELVEESDDADTIDAIVRQAVEFYENVKLDEDSVEKHRQRKLVDIDVYDNSDHVNGFYYNGNFMWLDKSTRVGLVNTLESAEELGRETVNIWYNNQVCIELDVQTARMFLAAIELYATDCYNVTASHKRSVMNMESVEEIDAFDITKGYPDMLHFGDESNNTPE